jgi:Cation transporter/ATPase, N-terminus
MFRFIFSGKLHPAILHKAVKAAAAAISEHEQKLIELCMLPAEEALQRVGVTQNGLSEEQVEAARQEYGSNILSHRKEAGIVMEQGSPCLHIIVSITPYSLGETFLQFYYSLCAVKYCLAMLRSTRGGLYRYVGEAVAQLFGRVATRVFCAQTYRRSGN